MKKTCPGFTLIELLIVISIMSILFSLGMAQYMKFNRQQILTQAILELKTNLTNAQSMALSGKKTCSGTFDGILVIFDGVNENYTIYSSCNMDPDERVQINFYQLSQGVGIEGNPGSILFKSLAGGTNLDVDQTITLSKSGVGNSSLTVTPAGKIDVVP